MAWENISANTSDKIVKNLENSTPEKNNTIQYN